jgi:hypothetical protein
LLILAAMLVESLDGLVAVLARRYVLQRVARHQDADGANAIIIQFITCLL